jgi:hypothetical protein
MKQPQPQKPAKLTWSTFAARPGPVIDQLRIGEERQIVRRSNDPEVIARVLGIYGHLEGEGVSVLTASEVGYRPGVTRQRVLRGERIAVSVRGVVCAVIERVPWRAP